MSDRRRYRPTHNRSTKEPSHSTTAEKVHTSSSGSQGKTDDIFKHTTKMGPGVSWPIFFKSLIESLRAAKLHAVANVMEERPSSSRQQIEEAQSQMIRAQADIEYLNLLLQTTKDSPPWSTQTQYNSMLQAQKDAYSEIVSKIQLEYPELVPHLREDLSKIFTLNKMPSKQSAEWSKLRNYLLEHRCPVDIGAYQPRPIAAHYAELQETTSLIAAAKSELDIAKSMHTQALSQQSSAAKDLNDQIDQVLMYFLQGNILQEVACRDRLTSGDLSESTKAFQASRSHYVVHSTNQKAI